MGNRFPALAATEFARLKADIEANGVRVAVLVDARDGSIVDGHHRARACEELGIEYPVERRAYADDAERRADEIRLNLMRRHMTAAERKPFVAELHALGQSTRAIAEATGIPKSTNARDAAASGVPSGTGDARTFGRDGKSYRPRATPQEREARIAKVVKLHDEGKSNKAIADALDLSAGTVSSDLATAAGKPKRPRAVPTPKSERAASIKKSLGGLRSAAMSLQALAEFVDDDELPGNWEDLYTRSEADEFFAMLADNLPVVSARIKRHLRDRDRKRGRAQHGAA